MGICLLFAEITDKQELVSPYNRTASGLTFSNISSDFIKILPIVSAVVFPTAFKK